MKLVRTVPVFVLGWAFVPVMLARRREIFAGEEAWPALIVGIFAMGWVLLAASVTLLSPNYVSFILFPQVLLAAGLLALGQKLGLRRERWLRAALVICVLLVSIRAIGMTTWGAVCAWKNSYASTQKVLRSELAAYATLDRPVLVSLAYLYCATDLGVKNAIHSDWYFDHTQWTNNAEAGGMCPDAAGQAGTDTVRLLPGVWEVGRAAPGVCAAS